MNRGKNETISIEDVRQDSKAESLEVEDEVVVKDNDSGHADVKIPEPEQKPVEKEKVVETPKPEKKEEETTTPAKEQVKVVGKIDLEELKPKSSHEKQKSTRKQTPEKPVEEKTAVPKEKTPENTDQPDQKTEAPVEKKKPEEKKEAVEKIETESPKINDEIKVVGKIDLSTINQRTRPPKKTKKQKEEERKAKQMQNEKAGGAGAKGKEGEGESSHRRKRKRIQKDNERVSVGNKQQAQAGSSKAPGDKRTKKRRVVKAEVSEEDVQKQIKETLARLTSKGKSKGAKHRRDKRQAISDKMAAEKEKQEQEKNVLKVTEFVSVNELASMMNISATDVISTCMGLGLFVSINQRLDAETMSLVADEFGYEVEFVSVELQESIEVQEDQEGDMESRPPIVTVMGHVDHGKTSLLDHIRKANVIAGEAGGITQHIGAYNVALEDGRKISFLDTPGHEAFTAMRARGAQVTDIAIIIIAADDSVMPQTIEAINHAAAAGVPMVFAINKIDKPGANPEKIKEALAGMNYLVEEWGGKYQSHDISAKNGIGIEELLEKVLLEAEMLELKANPNKPAVGSVIESSLDKGRGYVTTMLVQAGTLKVGDVVLAGQYFGHVKAMFNERNQRIEEVGPSGPVLMLGLNGAPQAGDRFNVMESEREARQIANKREQLQREQGLRTQKHITLDEIGRRIAIGNFQELNIVVKGDVDGSIEALSDSLIKLSTEEIQVNVIHKAVGQITESDVMLASASEAIVVGFQVRPSMSARKLAEKEQIDIRLYSIIYDAIAEVKAAMEGMLSPDIKEEIVSTVEVLETFKITKVGTIAGCIVRDGKIKRSSKVRVIRDGIVVYTGTLGSLKRFKDDAKEVAKGFECGLNIENFNDIKVGDFVEAYEEVEVSRTL